MTTIPIEALLGVARILSYGGFVLLAGAFLSGAWSGPRDARTSGCSGRRSPASPPPPSAR